MGCRRRMHVFRLPITRSTRSPGSSQTSRFCFSPTSSEVGVLNGKITPGDVVAIVGAGPIGLAAILTASLYTPGRIVSIDLTDSRLESAKRFGAGTTINNGHENAVAQIMELTDGLGAD